jgi:hypothetical protein
MPGSKALNTGKSGSVEALSCAGKGSCGATGSYRTANDNGFLASEAHGTWGRVLKISGLAALKASDVMLGAITCVSSGNCLAAGSYGTVTSGHALIVTQKNGVWGKAMGIRGF